MSKNYCKIYENHSYKKQEKEVKNCDIENIL